MELSAALEQEMSAIVPLNPADRVRSGGSGVAAARALSSAPPKKLVPLQTNNQLIDNRTTPASTASSASSSPSVPHKHPQLQPLAVQQTVGRCSGNDNASSAEEWLLQAFDCGKRELFLARLMVVLDEEEEQNIFRRDASRPVSRQIGLSSEEEQEQLMHKLQAAAEAGASSPRLLEFQLRIHFLLHAFRAHEKATCSDSGAEIAIGPHLREAQKCQTRLRSEQRHFQVWCEENSRRFMTKTNMLKYVALGYIDDIRAAGASFHELLTKEWTTRLRDVFANWLGGKMEDKVRHTKLLAGFYGSSPPRPSSSTSAVTVATAKTTPNSQNAAGHSLSSHSQPSYNEEDEEMDPDQAPQHSVRSNYSVQSSSSTTVQGLTALLSEAVTFLQVLVTGPPSKADLANIRRWISTAHDHLPLTHSAYSTGSNVSNNEEDQAGGNSHASSQGMFPPVDGARQQQDGNDGIIKEAEDLLFPKIAKAKASPSSMEVHTPNLFGRPVPALRPHVVQPEKHFYQQRHKGGASSAHQSVNESLKSGLLQLQKRLSMERSEEVESLQHSAAVRPVPANLFNIDMPRVKQYLRQALVDAAGTSPDVSAAERVITLVQALRHRIGRTMNSNRGRKRALESFVSADLLECTQNIGPRRKFLSMLLTDHSIHLLAVHKQDDKHPTGRNKTKIRRISAAHHSDLRLESKSPEHDKEFYDLWDMDIDVQTQVGVLRRMHAEALRFVSRITSFERGRRYLLTHPDTVQLLVQALQSEQADNAARRSALSALQKMSLKRQPQRKMIQLGAMEWICSVLAQFPNVHKLTKHRAHHGHKHKGGKHGKHSKGHGHGHVHGHKHSNKGHGTGGSSSTAGSGHRSSHSTKLSEFTQEYSLALLLNLSLCSAGKTKAEELKDTLMPLLKAMLQPRLLWLRNYVHGTLYSLFTRASLRDYATNVVNLPEALAKSKTFSSTTQQLDSSGSVISHLDSTGSGIYHLDSAGSQDQEDAQFEVDIILTRLREETMDASDNEEDSADGKEKTLRKYNSSSASLGADEDDDHDTDEDTDDEDDEDDQLQATMGASSPGGNELAQCLQGEDFLFNHFRVLPEDIANISKAGGPTTKGAMPLAGVLKNPITPARMRQQQHLRHLHRKTSEQESFSSSTLARNASSSIKAAVAAAAANVTVAEAKVVSPTANDGSKQPKTMGVTISVASSPKRVIV